MRTTVGSDLIDVLCLYKAVNFLKKIYYLDWFSHLAGFAVLKELKNRKTYSVKWTSNCICFFELRYREGLKEKTQYFTFFRFKWRLEQANFMNISQSNRRALQSANNFFSSSSSSPSPNILVKQATEKLKLRTSNTQLWKATFFTIYKNKAAYSSKFTFVRFLFIFLWPCFQCHRSIDKTSKFLYIGLQLEYGFSRTNIPCNFDSNHGGEPMKENCVDRCFYKLKVSFVLIISLTF